MSTFATLVIIFGILAGLVNLGWGIMRRTQPVVMLLRLVAALVGFGAAAGVVIAKSEGWHLPAELRTSESVIYLFIALGLFVGATMLLPSTIERNLFPAPKDGGPITTTIPTGKLQGTPNMASNMGAAKTTGTSGNKDENWVN